MRSVSEGASAETWTCRIVPRDGRLLDLAELARAVRRVGEQFSVRGVEASVVGEVYRREGQVHVRLSRTGEVLRLGPLTRKVQWDPEAGQDEPMTAAERGAYGRLRARWRGPRPIRIVGPLVEAERGGPLVLEVRQFSWLR